MERKIIYPSSFLYFVLLLCLLDCSHDSSRKQSLKSEAEAQERNLRVGMSFEEVQRKHSNLGNCQGSKASIMICEWQFSAKSDDGLSLAQIEITQNRKSTEDLPRHPDDGFIYELIFNEAKLSRWRLKDSSEGP